MEKELFYAYLRDENQLNDESLNQLMQITQKYPYFQTAKLILLKNMRDTQHPKFISELKNVAVECCDREKLFYYLNDERFARFFPKTKIDSEAKSESDRTGLLLDSFLASFEEKHVKQGQDSETDNQEEDNQLERDTIVSTDYLAFLEKTEQQEDSSDIDEDAKPMKHQDLVDSFLEKSSNNEILFSNKEREKEDTQNSTQDLDSLLDDDTFLTETLAQVYIKQKKYEQALTIIKRLSLNFPKKSIYFADQIRFLEYLILNDKNKKQK